MTAAEEILAATAHELRLPLSHIKGFVTSLRRTDIEWDDATRKEFIAEIDLETDRLGQLVDSLLASGARGADVPPEAHVALTDPASVLDGALHRIRCLLGGRTVRRNVPAGLPAVRMDANQMERVLANLIQNAIKYSPPGTPVGASAWITDDAELEFSVDDEGPGIPAEDRERIFEPFFRKQAAKQSEVSGHGLGLAICQSIVLAHGGRIQVSDRPGRGARFSVFLPVGVRARPTLRCAPRGQQFDNDYQPRDRGDDAAIDSTTHSRRGRRGADAQAPVQQPEGQRLRRAGRGGRCGGVETHRGAPVRPAAA